MRQAKFLALDKDGTLVRPKSGNEFVQSPEDQELLPGAAERVKEYARAGWLMAIVSNQGGVAAGHKSLESAINEMLYCLKLLRHIRFGLLCPDFEGRSCWFAPQLIESDTRSGYDVASEVSGFSGHRLVGLYRKPDAGLLFQAEMLMPFDVDINERLMVGDREEDEAAAAAAKYPFLWAKDWRETPFLPSI